MLRTSTSFILTATFQFFLFGCQRAPNEGDSKNSKQIPAKDVLNPEDNAQAVVDKAFEAYGGVKSFPKWNTGHLKYKTQGDALPGDVKEIITEELFVFPDHFKRIVQTSGLDKDRQMTWVINFGKGWYKEGKEAAKDIQNDFSDKEQHPFAGFSDFKLLTEKDVRLTKLGTQKIEDKVVIGIGAESEKLGKAEFYFCQRKGMVMKISRFQMLPGDEKQTLVETNLADYKLVKGSWIPMRFKTIQGEKTLLDVAIFELNFDPEFPEGTFGKP